MASGHQMEIVTLVRTEVGVRERCFEELRVLVEIFGCYGTGKTISIDESSRLCDGVFEGDRDRWDR